jgi:hypothetical protein
MPGRPARLGPRAVKRARAAGCRAGLAWRSPASRCPPPPSTPTRAVTQYRRATRWSTREGFPRAPWNRSPQTADGYVCFGDAGGLARPDGVRIAALRLQDQTRRACGTNRVKGAPVADPRRRAVDRDGRRGRHPAAGRHFHGPGRGGGAPKPPRQSIRPGRPGDGVGRHRRRALPGPGRRVRGRSPGRSGLPPAGRSSPRRARGPVGGPRRRSRAGQGRRRRAGRRPSAGARDRAVGRRRRHALGGHAPGPLRAQAGRGARLTRASPRLPGPVVAAIRRDRDGSLWVGTENGAARLAGTP